jgi:transporter family-2 protein
MVLLSQPIAVRRLGAAMYVGLFVTASTVLSVIFDHFGWLGLSQHSAGIGGVLGCALMAIRLGLVSLF